MVEEMGEEVARAESEGMVIKPQRAFRVSVAKNVRPVRISLDIVMEGSIPRLVIEGDNDEDVVPVTVSNAHWEGYPTERSALSREPVYSTPVAERIRGGLIRPRAERLKMD